LMDLQKSNNVPDHLTLGVCISNNTRKWSSGYTMIARIVRIQNYIFTLQSNPLWSVAQTDFHEQRIADAV
jgi:hypothetical protein